MGLIDWAPLLSWYTYPGYLYHVLRLHVEQHLVVAGDGPEVAAADAAFDSATLVDCLNYMYSNIAILLYF